MRVAFVHNLARGGAHRTLTEHLRRIRWEVRELCLETAAPVTGDARVVPFAPRAQSRHPALRPALRYLDMAALVRAWVRLAGEVNRCEADAVVVHPCQYLQGPPALRSIHAPALYFCHETRRVDYEAAAAATRSRLTMPIYWPLYRWQRATDRAALAAAGVLLTNSRFTAARIEAAYGRRAIPLMLGVADGFTAPTEPEAPKHLLSVGMLLPDKGHELAIAASACSRSRRPVIVVSPRPDADEEARLRGLAARNGVACDIRVAVSDNTLRDLYRSALATLYLAREEPFGLASLEAQACGCPVIVAADGGLPETIVEGHSGWAVSRNPEAAAACLDRLEAPEIRGPMAQRAARHAARYTWARSTCELERAIGELVTGQGHDAPAAPGANAEEIRSCG